MEVNREKKTNTPAPHADSSSHNPEEGASAKPTAICVQSLLNLKGGCKYFPHTDSAQKIVEVYGYHHVEVLKRGRGQERRKYTYSSLLTT